MEKENIASLMKNKLIRITTVPISLDKLLGPQLSFMSRYFGVTAVSANNNKLARIAAKYGVSHYNVEMTREITPFKDLKALWKLYRFFKKEKPQIVHTHTPKAGVVGMLAARFADVPVRLHTVAGMPLMEAGGFKRRVLDAVEKLTYASATKVYPNSAGLQEFILQNRYARPEKLKIIASGSSNGIDTELFSPDHYTAKDISESRTKYSIGADDFVFVFVGRVVAHKGLNELVSAFREITDREKARRIKLLIVGPFEPQLDPLLPETLHEIDQNPSIVTVGYQEDVRPFFAIADVLVFPSYREGFPNVVMQAGAMGLPAIVTDINGCNEIIIEGKNGTIIPPKSAEDLMQAMHRMYTDSQWRGALQKNARKMITERYEQHVVWDALLAEYNSQLEKAGFCRTEAIVM